MEGKQFVRDGPRFYGKAKGFREPSGQPGFGGAFGGSGQRKTSASDPSSGIPHGFLAHSFHANEKKKKKNHFKICLILLITGADIDPAGVIVDIEAEVMDKD